MKDLVNLNDFLIEPFYVDLSDECRISLINKSLSKIGSKENLSNKLNCSKKSLNEIIMGQTRYGRRFIPAHLLKNLLSILSLDAIDIESYVLHLKRGRNTREVAVNLPLNPSPELSLLVAKALGDGCICSDWRFDYKNNSMELLDEVIMAVEKAIGKSKFTLNDRGNNCYDLKFSPVIGYILYLLGVPKSYKINQEAKIPYWIMNGDVDIKRNFLRAIYDDESCVDAKGKRIIFALGKTKEFEASLKNFLDSMRDMLKSFGIDSARINLQKEYGKNVILRFGIYGRNNFQRFQEKIGFTNTQKSKSLEILNASYLDLHKTKNQIFESIINSSIPLNTLDVAKINNLNHKSAASHLSNLFHEGKIGKSKDTNPVIWWLPDAKLPNNNDRIIELLGKKELTANNISKNLSLDYKYVFSLLKHLEYKKLVKHSNSHPMVWNIN